MGIFLRAFFFKLDFIVFNFLNKFFFTLKLRTRFRRVSQVHIFEILKRLFRCFTFHFIKFCRWFLKFIRFRRWRSGNGRRRRVKLRAPTTESIIGKIFRHTDHLISSCLILGDSKSQMGVLGAGNRCDRLPCAFRFFKSPTSADPNHGFSTFYIHIYKLVFYLNIFFTPHYSIICLLLLFIFSDRYNTFLLFINSVALCSVIFTYFINCFIRLIISISLSLIYLIICFNCFNSRDLLIFFYLLTI